MNKYRLLRNYKTNIESKLLENEYIIVDNKKLESLIDTTRSTATIITYLYICLKVNKSKDNGYLRNIKCEYISDDTGIPLSTVQEAICTLVDKKFITRTFNKDKLSDYQVLDYKNILKFKKAYIKIPASLVLNNTFLQSSKDEVAGVLSVYSSIYLNVVAKMKQFQSLDFLKDKQNFELIENVENSRVFSKETLLSKIKRIKNKDLDRVLDKFQKLGLTVKNMFKKGISITTNYSIGINRDILNNLFRPFISHSHIKNNPLAFNTVSTILHDTNLTEYVKDEDYEDLTQMYVQYGALFFQHGILSLQNVVYNHYALIDEDGDKIDNLPAYFRVSVESFIEKYKK